MTFNKYVYILKRIFFAFLWNILTAQWIYFYNCIFFLSFRATPAVYRNSQARGLIRVTAAGLGQRQIQASSATYTTAHGNARSLTHWARSGIEPATSWFLVRFISAAPHQELQVGFFDHKGRTWLHTSYLIPQLKCELSESIESVLFNPLLSTVTGEQSTLRNI